MDKRHVAMIAKVAAAVLVLSQISVVASMVVEIHNAIRYNTTATFSGSVEGVNRTESALKIAIITLGYGPSVEDYAPNTLLINGIYAKRYNYALLYGRPSTNEVADSRRHVSWHKLRLALQVLEEGTFDYVMWMDVDAVFHNHWIRIEDIIFERPEADFFICTNNHEDISSLPFGQVDKRIVIRNSDWTRNFLSEWWNSAFDTGYEKLRPWEQEALHSIWFGSGDRLDTKKPWLGISKHTAVFQHNRFNTASEESVFSRHLTESFVFHCVAQTQANRYAIFEALAGEWSIRLSRAESAEDVPGFLVSSRWLRQNLIKHFRRDAMMKKSSAVAFNRYGIALHNSGEIEKALSAFSTAVALDADCTEFGEITCINVHMNMGMTASRLGDSSLEASAFDTTFRKITSAVINGGSDLHNWNVYQFEQMAVSLFRSGKHLEAELAIRTAVAMQPTASHVHYFLSMMLTPRLGWPVLTDRREEALQHIEIALNIEPDSKKFQKMKNTLLET